MNCVFKGDTVSRRVIFHFKDNFFPPLTHILLTILKTNNSNFKNAGMKDEFAQDEYM